jgi:heme O synthase-like polyprenyltransferase
MRLYLTRSDASARSLFFASIAYLPLLLGLMILDRNAAPPRTGTSVAALTADAGG